MAWCTRPCPSEQLSLSYIGVRSADVSNACERNIGRVSLEMSDHWQKKKKKEETAGLLSPHTQILSVWGGRPEAAGPSHHITPLLEEGPNYGQHPSSPRVLSHGILIFNEKSFPKAEHCSTRSVWQSQLWCLLSAGWKCNSWPHAGAGVQAREVGTLSVLLGQWQPGTRN